MRKPDVAPSMTGKPQGQCEGKEAHESAHQAKKVVRNMRRFGKAVIAYRCPTCQAWHVGRPKPRVR